MRDVSPAARGAGGPGPGPVRRAQTIRGPEAIPRRAFLGRAIAGALLPAVSRASPADSRPGPKAPPAGRFEPEYARRLEEVLIVYDQVAADYLFGEVVALLGCLPPPAAIHVLCSASREAEARARLGRLGPGARIVRSEGLRLWGDWGRDIFCVGWEGDRTVLLVPYTKTARTRGELTRGFEVLRALASPTRAVRLVPLAFEGGNMAYDRVDGERVLFVGNAVLLESIAFYRRWFGRALAPRDVLAMLRRAFRVDRVIPLGRTRGKAPLPQARLLFHIDLACAIVAEGEVAVERFEPPAESALREDIEGEVEEEERGRPSIARVLRAEMARLREAEQELEAVRRTFRALGYRIHDLPADWRRVRRTQSYANVLVARNRLIMPIFPRPRAARARVTLGPEGREVVRVLRAPRAEDYAMTGANLACYRVYRGLTPNVRVVRDAFYLAGGNVHCVLGGIA